jgi:FMN-dependent oxidoreductase (nitrilotriacetate monooxygenase family)
MEARKRMMRLGAFFQPAGHHISSWRHESAQADAGMNFKHYVQIAQTAEKGLFDMMFLADRIGFIGEDRDVLKHTIRNIAHFEPLTLLSALAPMTTRLGLAATQTTSYNEPYHIARKMASLDQISSGRAAWNVVTTGNSSECFNFGRDEHFEHGFRYERATEFTEVVLGLWDSWEDDAFLFDKHNGIYFNPKKLHQLNHKGEHFTVRGPLNVPRSPQGRPVIIQAGTSEPARQLSARFADVIFSAEENIERARLFYSDVKGRLPTVGRHADDVKIMPGLMPIVGRSKSEAEDKFAAMQALIPPVVGLNLLSQVMGVDVSGYDPDAPLPDIPGSNRWSRSELVVNSAADSKLTLRQSYQKFSAARGHRVICGTAAEIVDAMEEWFEADAADGFNIMPATLPGGLNDFVAEVVPELQRRSLFRTSYEGKTLRENLGLSRPAHPAAEKVDVTTA